MSIKTSEENVILSDIKFLNQTDKNPFVSSIDLKGLPTVITKFKTYLKGGETND